jgi:hypothetical protein
LHTVFISYASNERKLADTLCSTLESRGIKCWIAPRDVAPGKNYGEEIVDAIGASRALVLMLSSSANVSAQVLREAERAVGKNIPIVTFRVEEVEPSKQLEYFISTYHWLDGIGSDFDAGSDKLADAIKRLVSSPQGQLSVATARRSTHEAMPAHAKKKGPFFYWLGWLLMVPLGAVIFAEVVFHDVLSHSSPTLVGVSALGLAALGVFLLRSSRRRNR